MLSGGQVDYDEAIGLVDMVADARGWPDDWREEAYDILSDADPWFGSFDVRDVDWPSYPDRAGWNKLGATFGAAAEGEARQEAEDSLSANIGQEVEEFTDTVSSVAGTLQKNRDVVGYAFVALIALLLLAAVWALLK